MSVAEPGLQRLRMSWEDYLALPDRPKAEWVDGEVVVSPPVGPQHGVAVLALAQRIREGLPDLLVMTEVGVALPANRLRAPDLMAVTSWPEAAWVTEVPVLVVEVLSPSTRSEDLVRKSTEYLAAGVGQYWIVDPEAGVVVVSGRSGGGWETISRLDATTPTAEVAVPPHGVVTIDRGEILPLA